MKYDIMRVSPVAAIWQLHEAALKPDAFEPSIAAETQMMSCVLSLPYKMLSNASSTTSQPTA
jgi:hypothetical protein